MKISFLGACLEVGRSSVAVSDSEASVVFDSGIKIQGTKMSEKVPKDCPNLDAVIISHAHVDHTGYLPKTAAKSKQVIMTSPTEPISKILLEDTLKVSTEQGMEFFSEAQLEKTWKKVNAVGYGDAVKLGRNSVTFYDAGHIMGSAQCLYKTKKGSLLYSGDIKTKPMRLHDGIEWPEGEVEALVIESTYGTKEHEPREKTEKDFAQSVRETVESGMHALIPAFAVGRSQELVRVLRANKVSAPIFLDGMAKKVTETMLEYPDYMSDYEGFLRDLKGIEFVRGYRERKKVFSEPCVVISPAGMLTGGPSLGYLKDLNKRKKAKVFLTGFQVEGTNGRMLLETGRIQLGNVNKKIELEVAKFDFSAHAGKSELLSYAKKINPQKVFCIHGEKESCIGLARTLNEKGFKAVAPEIGQSFEA